MNEDSYAFREVIELADDHKLDLREFLSRLVRVTNVSGGKDQPSLQKLYERMPSLGPRSISIPSIVSETKEETSTEKREKTYAWNETTMAQNLRKMQYAVRGEVVLKADLLKDQGRDIIYTNIGNPHAVGQKCITF